MTLHQGDVYIVEDIPFFGSEPHYCIVLKEIGEEKIIVTYSTSQFEVCYARCQRDERIKFTTTPPETYIELENGWCPSVHGASAINCNNVALKKINDVLLMPRFKKLSPVNNINVIHRIILGVKRSIKVEERIKRLLE